MILIIQPILPLHRVGAPPTDLGNDTASLMNGISIIKATTEAGYRWPARKGNPLRPGDRITAKVLGVGKNGMARLDLGHITVMAAMRVPVTQGMQLPLEVVATAGQLLLKIRGEQRRRATQPNKAQPQGDATREKRPPSRHTVLGDRMRIDEALAKHRSLSRAMIKPIAPFDHQQESGKSVDKVGQPVSVAPPPTPSSSPERMWADRPPRKSFSRTEDRHVAMSLSLRPMGDAHADLRLTPEGLHVTLRVAEEAALRLLSEQLEALTSALKALAPSVWIDARRQSADPSPPGSLSRHTRVSVDV